MIYVCVAARNNTTTVGLLLWKLRQVFRDFPREYHILVADDASTDGTRETLETYQRALPMTLIRQSPAGGYAASLEALLRDALGRSDRPRRDGAAVLPADFTVSPAALPDLIRRFESGADLVVGESTVTRPFGLLMVRRAAPWLLRPGLTVPGVRDFTSGVSLVRLVTLRSCLRDRDDPLLQTDGPCAYAEFLARAAAAARQIAAVPLPADTEFADRRRGTSALGLAMSYYRAGRQLAVPQPQAAVTRP